MIKVNIKKNSSLGFILMMTCFIHLPIVFAAPKSVKTNLFYLAKSKNAVNVPAAINNNAFLNTIYDSLQLNDRGLSRKVFEYAIKGFSKIRATGALENERILSVIDFSKPSSQKRLFIIDIINYKLLFNTYVAHGINSGAAFAKYFSNSPESNKSSLGFYKTADTYTGRNGYSLHLLGLEKGFNDNAYKRDIVIHPADYVSEQMIRSKGWIGRSWGCPALPEYLSRQIIDKIKNGTCLFIFGADKKYLLRSSMLRESSRDLAFK